MNNLVIVESPTKARTIGRFLGKEYTIKPSMGHVMDLPKSTLGVDTENNFKPQLQVVEDKKPLLSELKSLAKNADTIILATDPDREGEAISANIQELLMEGNGKIPKEKFKRIVFHEITDEAVKDALNHPRTVDDNLVGAQVARRVLDRLVGYQLSPLLWKKVRRGLSAGRVQSVALRLIVEREREIEKFHKELYFTIHAMLSKKSDSKLPVEFELVEINKEKIEETESYDLYDGTYKISKTTVDSKEKADTIVQKLEYRDFVIADVIQKETKRSPQPPFITSTLQQEASRRFGYPGKRTMSLAQKLYEEGYITYHRTDSVVLSMQAITSMRDYAKRTFGERYVPEQNRFYTTKQKLAQEAHEAIRPTKITVTVDHVKGDLGAEYGKLYDMIWRRALASQMSDAIVESTTLYADTTEKSGEDTYRFKANGSVLIFDGFLKVNMQALQDTRLPDFTTGEDLVKESIRADEHETPAPPRYNDASLINTLEEKGIGRPSTYASIISTIADRGYIERVERRFEPTPVGKAVNDFLVTNFSDIDDIPFTANMEDDLDAVADGKREWVSVLKEFYTPFEKKIGVVEQADRVKIAVEETEEECPECHQAKLVIRSGRFGKFLSCARFPECKFTKPMVEETDITCPKCNGKVIIKKTRRGRKFYGCSNYPDCDFAAWKLEDIKGAKAAADGQVGVTVQSHTNVSDTLPSDAGKLPRIAGKFEEKDMQIAIGRFGPYIKHDAKFYSIPRDEDVYELSEERAIEIIKAKREKDANNTIKTFPEDPTAIILNGRFGAYIKFGKQNIRIPKGTEAASLTYEQVQKLAGVEGGKTKTKKLARKSSKKK